jgi:predicted AAA+ superfamily ATPase
VLAPDAFDEALAALDAVPGADEALRQIEQFTGFPEPLFAGRAARLRRWRRSRRDLVLRDDLRDLTRIREIGLVDHLVELLPERVGSPLSVNALREDLGVAYDTTKARLATLARLYYAFELRPFAGKLARTLRREAKVYLFDFTEIDDPGARFENLVARHLTKLVDAWNDRGQGDFTNIMSFGS